MRSVDMPRGKKRAKRHSMKTTEDFLDIVSEHMRHLQMFYHKFEDKKPVMVLSLPSRRIYAYPCREYLKTLSERSQKMLRKEYREAVKKHGMVVFVCDEETRVLKSATFPIAEITHEDV